MVEAHLWILSFERSCKRAECDYLAWVSINHAWKRDIIPWVSRNLHPCSDPIRPLHAVLHLHPVLQLHCAITLRSEAMQGPGAGPCRESHWGHLSARSLYCERLPSCSCLQSSCAVNWLSFEFCQAIDFVLLLHPSSPTRSFVHKEGNIPLWSFEVYIDSTAPSTCHVKWSLRIASRCAATWYAVLAT